MPHDFRRMRRYNSITLEKNVLVHFCDYASPATKAEITTPGYFNASRVHLTVNSIIHAVSNAEGSGKFMLLRVTNVDEDVGDVTVFNILEEGGGL